MALNEAAGSPYNQTSVSVGCSCLAYELRFHLQGFLALLGYAVIARFAALQFLGETTSLAAAAAVGLAMDMSGLLFIYAHRILAWSYAAACQAGQATSFSNLQNTEEKKAIRVPHLLAVIAYIFMSEQPAIPVAQVCLISLQALSVSCMRMAAVPSTAWRQLAGMGELSFDIVVVANDCTAEHCEYT